MTADYQLPGRADGVDGLLALAERLGPASTFNLIRTCRVAQGRGADPGGDTLTVLGKRVLSSETLRAGGDEAAGRVAAAAKLGYSDWKTRTNFDKVIKREPATRGDRELLRLARVHGAAAVYDLIRLARGKTNTENDAGRQALTALAQRLVNTKMESDGVDFDTARQLVADDLGYTAKRDGNGRANFYKILAGGRAPETRPRNR